MGSDLLACIRTDLLLEPWQFVTSLEFAPLSRTIASSCHVVNRVEEVHKSRYIGVKYRIGRAAEDRQFSQMTDGPVPSAIASA